MVTRNIFSEYWKILWHQDTVAVAAIVVTLFGTGMAWDHVSYRACHSRAAAIHGSVDHEYGRGYFVRDQGGRRLDMGHF